MTLTPGPSPADVLLSDGAVAVVRGVVPGDGPALHDLHERVSDDALRMRFFSVTRRVGHTYVGHVLTSPDTLALVAEVRGRVVALATAEPIDHLSSEVAFLVDDEHRGLGLGTLLLEHIAAMARDRGVRRLEAEVLAENRGMLEVFADAGFRVERRLDTGVEVLEIDTAVTEAVQAAADEREFRAEARSLAPMLAPRSVAVYGVRRDGSGVGAALLASIRSGGFRGDLVAIHPRATEVCGVPALASLADHGTVVDLAVIAVPAARAVAALEDACRTGVRAAVVISSGFSEMGAEGAELQQRLSDLARSHGTRLVGPNCLGLVCNAPDVRMSAIFSGSRPAEGGLAIASQSGGVGIALMDLMARAGLGVRFFVSLGNKADVSSNDLLAAWYDDDAVTCAALYLESFGNARKFARFARRFSERKPLLAVVGGRSQGGRRAGASHTAAAASPHVAVRALFAQAGVIACADAEELAQTAALLTREPLPAGRRLAVVSNAGGLGVLAADAAEEAGLDVVEFSGDLGDRIAGLVHQTTGVTNPVDAGAGAGAGQVGAMVEAVLDSAEIDAVLVPMVATGSIDLDEALRELARISKGHPTVPVVAVPLGAVTDPADSGATTFASAAAATGALGKAARYSEWRRSVPGLVEPSDAMTVRESRALARTWISNDESGGWVAPRRAGDLLQRYGVRLEGRVARGQDAAVEAAVEVGFPVAVKLAEADVVHKTEHRLVRIGLGDPAAVRQAVADMEQARTAPAEVLVQPMASGTEIALGIVRDPSLGPLVMVAAGGVATDVWDDHVFLVPPFDVAAATRALRSLRIWPLLDGFRGAEPADTDALAALVANLGRLSTDVPEVAELDLNPVMVGPEGCYVVDAKLRVADPTEVQLDVPRQLRRVR